MIWGKVVCTLFGFLLGTRGGLLGSIVAGLIGYAIGDMFDKGIKQDDSKREPLLHFDARGKSIFFASTFSVMGFIAKSDGRVSESEIAAAERVMSQLGLDANLRQEAIHCFNQGKEPSFKWTRVLDDLLKYCSKHSNLLQLFLEIQIETAYAEGQPTKFKQDLLLKIADWLGFSERDFLMLVQMFVASSRFQQKSSSDQGNQSNNRCQYTVTSLDDAYQVLGISKHSDDKAIKTAYRKLISQHHPDKLVSKGLPEEMIKIANEKTQQIKAAYEKIREHRGFK